MEILSLLFLMFLFSLMMTLIFKGRKRSCKVLEFRNYHRIDWLRKKRALKVQYVKR